MYTAGCIPRVPVHVDAFARAYCCFICAFKVFLLLRSGGNGEGEHGHRGGRWGSLTIMMDNTVLVRPVNEFARTFLVQRVLLGHADGDWEGG